MQSGETSFSPFCFVSLCVCVCVLARSHNKFHFLDERLVNQMPGDLLLTRCTSSLFSLSLITTLISLFPFISSVQSPEHYHQLPLSFYFSLSEPSLPLHPPILKFSFSLKLSFHFRYASIYFSSALSLHFAHPHPPPHPNHPSLLLSSQHLHSAVLCRHQVSLHFYNWA